MDTCLVEWVTDLDARLEQDLSKDETNRLLLYFSQLTSEVSGIFHIWEEGRSKATAFSAVPCSGS